MEKNRLFRSNRTDSKSLSLLYQRSLRHRDRGDIAKALSCLEEGLLNVFSQDSTQISERGSLADCWLEYGRLLRLNNQHAKAIYALEQCSVYPGYEIEAMTEWGDLLHEQGYSDEIIADRLKHKLAHLPEATELLIDILCRIGAFHTAFTYFAENLMDQSGRMLELYSQCLIREGLYEQALNLASSAVDAGQLRPELTDPLAMDALLCKWKLGEEDRLAVENRQLLSESLKRSVHLGLLDLSHQIAGDDSYLQNELTLGLYQEGYTELAKQKLRTYDLNSLNLYEPLRKEMAFITAEIDYDEGRYDQAAQIFECLIEHDPLTASYRFAAASCYLQISYRQMEQRSGLLMHDPSNLIKTQQYMETMTQSLFIVHRSKWHTEWTPAQRRNRQVRSFQ